MAGTTIPRSVYEYSAEHRPDNAFSGRSAVLLGKGPSLDVWLEDGCLWGPLHPVFVSVNEALLVAMDVGLQADFAFACDQGPLARIALRQDEFPGTVFILPMIQPRHIEPPANIAQYMYGEMDTRPLETTAAVALKWCGLAGIRDVWMVGFDGFDEQKYPPVERAQGYAEGVLKLGVDDTELPSWKNANLDIELALKRTGITARWFHRERVERSVAT